MSQAMLPPGSLLSTMDPAHPQTFNHRSALLSTGRIYHFVTRYPLRGLSSRLSGIPG